MSKLLPLLIMILSFTSCAGKRDIDTTISIEISNAQTWKIDLKKDVYTVFYLSKPPLEIKLGLTEDEQKRLIDTWYSLELDRIPGKTLLNDKCLIMPKLYAVIRATTAHTSQEITIDNNCDDFSLFDAGKAERVKKFIKLVKDIVFSRPAVRDAPKSNIFYM
jgi:hypothetical protein